MGAVKDRLDYEEGWAALADPADARPAGLGRRKQIGAGALLALAGAMGLHTADAKAMLPADGGGGSGKATAPTHTDASDGYAGMHGSGSAPPPTQPKPAKPSAPPKRTVSSSPPARTDASDGYAGMGPPTPVREGTRPSTSAKSAPTKPAKPKEPAKSSAPPKRTVSSPPPTRTDASDGYAGMNGAPTPVREGTRPSTSGKSAPAKPKDPAKPSAPPKRTVSSSPPARTDASDGYAGMGPPTPVREGTRSAPPTHTDASDGYAGLHGSPPAKQPSPTPVSPANRPPIHTDASDGYDGLVRPKTDGRTDAADGYFGLGTLPPAPDDTSAGVGASGEADVSEDDGVGDKILGLLGDAKDTATELPGDVADGAGEVKDFAVDHAGEAKDFAEEHAFDATPLGPALGAADQLMPGFRKDFTKGAIEDTATGLYDLGKSGVKMGPVGTLVDPEGAAEERDKWKKTGIYAYNHPLDTLKAVSGYDQIEDGHPGRFAGGLLPTVATLPLGGEGALTKIPSAARGLTDLSRLSKAERTAKDLERLAPKKLPEAPKVPEAPKLPEAPKVPEATVPVRPPVEPEAPRVTRPAKPPAEPPKATAPAKAPAEPPKPAEPPAPAKPVPAKPAKRPSWRESEQYVGDQLGPDYRDNKVSYLDGKVVPYGTRGSSRPDFTTGTIRSHVKVESFEVKNYGVSTASGRSRLAGNIAKQAAKGKKNLPPGSHQQWVIDARGQGLTRAMADKLAQQIVRRSNGNVRLSDIDILR